MVQVSSFYLSFFFLLEDQISVTIILTDLIFCKLNVIPYTLFSMHKVYIWSLKNRWLMNVNCVLLTIKKSSFLCLVFHFKKTLLKLPFLKWTLFFCCIQYFLELINPISELNIFHPDMAGLQKRKKIIHLYLYLVY